MKKSTYLFSIDLEDVRFGLDNGEQYEARVPKNTQRYLEWMDKYGFRCTFFIVGNIAATYPSLVKEIYDRGHEIACHTVSHIPLDKRTPKSFQKDLEENLDLLYKCGIPKEAIKGFRAPIFSLTEKTAWAYEVLKNLGFTYSSSVLPAKNPLYGWENFGQKHQIMNNGILEIPMSLEKFGPLNIPYAGGTYFRMLPHFLIKNKLKKQRKKETAILGYFHPYDIDTEQERFMMPGINNSKIYNWLMYYNRSQVFKRLDAMIASGFEIITYSEYIHKEQLS